MANTIKTVSSITIIRAKDLAKELGINISTLYNWINPKSEHYDPTFPSAIALGSRARGWRLAEIVQWMTNNEIKKTPTDQS